MVGLPAAHLLSAVLYEVRPADPLTIAATLCTLLVVAGLASHFPSRAATRVDPMVVLRAE
jgi:ABC-type lipoprotein release transport system permease subunit